MDKKTKTKEPYSDRAMARISLYALILGSFLFFHECKNYTVKNEKNELYQLSRAEKINVRTRQISEIEIKAAGLDRILDPKEKMIMARRFGI